MTGLLVLLGALAVALILIPITNMKGTLMSQVDDLRSAIAQLGTDLSEAITRVEAKLVELGEPDPDLTADIAAIRDASTKLDELVAAPTPPVEPPTEPPTEPVPPTEPPVEPPAEPGL